MFVCPSVILTHGTTRVPMERFFENEHFFISRKSVENFLIEGMQLCFSTHNKTPVYSVKNTTKVYDIRILLRQTFCILSLDHLKANLPR